MTTCKDCYHWSICHLNWGNEPEPDSADGCVNYVDRKVIEGLLQPKPFKNVRPEQVKHLIVKTIEEFREDVRSAVQKSAYPFVSCGKVEFFDDIGYRSKYETMSRLSEYYGVEVVAVEPEDEVEAKRVLIEFTGKKVKFAIC